MINIRPFQPLQRTLSVLIIETPDLPFRLWEQSHKLCVHYLHSPVMRINMLKPLSVSKLLGCYLVLLFTSLSSQAAIPVTITTPIASDITTKLTLSGSLTAQQRAWLSPRVDGLVKEVLVDAGDSVKQGEVLLRQDPAISQQQLAQTKAAVNEAQVAVTEAERLVKEAKRLREDNYISATELANREANVALRQAALAAAQAMHNTAAEQLRRHELPAPFSGVISAKETEAGEWINRGTPVLELVALTPVRLDVNVPQERFSDITSDSRVEILPDSLPNRKLDGKIIALVPISNPQARSFLVRVLVDSQDVSLLPGTSATAVIHISSDSKGYRIPQDAVMRHADGGRSVFIVDSDNRAQRRNISVSMDGSEGGVTVTEGIAADDRVVVRGNELLRNNDVVEIISDDRQGN